MLLRMDYDPLFLQDAHPFTLSVFRWVPDDNSGYWTEVDSHIFDDNHFVSVSTNIFATYALMATSRWYDDFDDINGLSDWDDVNLKRDDNNTLEFIVLDDDATTGYVRSLPITPTTTISNWGTVTFDYTLETENTTVTVDVLDVDGTIVRTNIVSGTSLADLSVEDYPALQLQATLSTTQAGETPQLDSWRLSWNTAVISDEEYNQYLPIIIK